MIWNLALWQNRTICWSKRTVLYDLRASTWLDANFSSILYEKIYFFYFIYLFLQNTHISLSILHIYSIKYLLFYHFLLFTPLLPLSLTDPQSITTNDHSTPSHHHHHHHHPTTITHPTNIIKKNQPTQSETLWSPTQPKT